jgi:hypothetical protein
MRRVKKGRLGGFEVLRNASKAASLSRNSNKECLKENVRRNKPMQNERIQTKCGQWWRSLREFWLMEYGIPAFSLTSASFEVCQDLPASPYTPSIASSPPLPNTNHTKMSPMNQ